MKVTQANKYNDATSFWTVAGMLCLFGSSHAGSGGPSINFEATVGTDAGSCATTNQITVFPGTTVNHCYKITNTGDVVLTNHDLNSDEYGVLLNKEPVVLNPGESHEFFNLQSVTSTLTTNATWKAYANPAYNFIDISSSGAALGIGDDEEADVSMDFSFTFFGNSSTDMTVSNNGAIRFGVSGADIDAFNEELSTDSAGNLIAPFWDDLDSETGDVYTETIGIAPERIFIVQWENRPHYSGANPQTGATFQVQLFEGSNEIQFHYKNVVFGNTDNPDWDNGNTATVGVGGGSSALQYSFDTPSLLNEMALSMIPFGETVSEMTATTVMVNEADIEVQQSSIDFFMNPDQTESKNLGISNVGSLTLDWTLEQGQAAGRQREFKRLPSMPPVKAPDFNIDTGPAPHTVTHASSQGPNELTLLSGSTASAIRSFGDPVNTLTSFNITNPGVFTDVATNAAFFGVNAGDFLGADFTTLYGLRASNNELIAIDVATGNITSIGTTAAPPNGEDWSGMTWDPETGNMYATSAASGGSTLFTIDVTDASVTQIGAITSANFIIDIAADAAGMLYGVDISTNELVGIDKDTGNGTSIGPLGIALAFAQDLDFDHVDNTLYLASCVSPTDCGRMFTINLATGEATEVAQIGMAPSEYTAFGIQSVNFCDQPVAWISLSETSGSTNLGETSTVGVNIDTAGLALGNYSTDICINSNDPDEPLTVVPVNVEVNNLDNDIIFTDGFEAPPVL